MSDGLHGQMRALADRGHPRAIELRAKADEFEAKATALYGSPKESTKAELDARTKSMMGAWARARRLWSECTGEPIL
jgi:hypothetical protein